MNKLSSDAAGYCTVLWQHLLLLSPRILLILMLVCVMAQPARAVNLDGDIRATDGSPICAMVLASGQFMFSCSPYGLFALNDLPREPDGSVKRQLYADGFFPQIDILPDTTNDKVALTRSGSCPSYNPTSDPGSFPNAAGEHVTISGKILLQDTQMPVCALVLANGQHMFSCDGTGNYALNIPLDVNGQYKLQVFADGFAPTVLHHDQFSTSNNVRLARAVECETFPEDNTVARVEVTPTTLLLTGIGDTLTLSAQAYNAAGQPVDADFTWASNDTDTVTVDANGLASAASPLGSAQITAEADGVLSAPALAVVAMPALNSVLVDDDEVIGEPELVDPNADYDIGTQYRVTVYDTVTPEIGDILLATGEAEVGGRVVDVTDLGNGTQLVTLEVIPVEQLFTSLVIDEDIDLSAADFEVPSQTAQYYTEAKQPDGSVVFTLRPGISGPVEPEVAFVQSFAVRAEDRYAPLATQAQGTTALGPFGCELTGTLPISLSQIPPTVPITGNMNLDLHYDSSQGGLQKILLKGDLGVEARIKPVLTASLAASFECKGEFFTITLPIGGPLALLFGGQVPIGAGFSLGGKLIFAQLGFDIFSKAKASAQVGVQCPGGMNCEVIAPEPTVDLTADYKFVFPDPNNIPGQVQFEPTLGAFAYAELAIGTRFSRNLRISAFQIKAGPTQAANLGFVDRQVLDDTYKSNYKLTADLTIGTAAGFNKLLNLLSFTAVNLTLTFKNELASSPKLSSFVIDPFNFTAGDTVIGTLKLDPATVNYPLIGYNVEKILIYHKNGNNADFVREFPAFTGQTDFNINWAETPSMNTPDYFAFVETVGLPDAPMFTELELGKASPPCAQTHKPIEDGEIFPGEWDGKMPTVDGVIPFLNKSMQFQLEAGSGPNEYVGTFRSSGIVGLLVQGLYIFDVTGTIMPIDQGGAVDLTVSVSPADPTPVYSSGGVDHQMSIRSFKFGGKIEVICESDSGFDFAFLTLSGSHSLGDVYVVARIGSEI